MKISISVAIALLTLSQGAFAEQLDCVVNGAKEQHVRAQQQSAVEQEIMALERKACQMIVAGEIDQMIDSIISTSGLLLAAGGGIVVGNDAQRGMFKEFLAAGYAIEFEPTDAFVSQSEDLAWAYGLYRLIMPEGGEDIGKYVSVWAKEHGEWKNVAEMRNSGK